MQDGREAHDVIAESARAPRTVELAEKLAFLRRPESYPDRPAAVDAIETHAAWVFLTPRFAYKLRKPVRLPFLDFTTLARRRRDAGAEVRLNRRLAPDVYLDVVPLTADPGGLHFGGPGRAVEWLVRMRRLEGERFLDRALAAGTADAAGLEAVARLLVDFYRFAPRVAFTPDEYRARLRADIAASARALAEPRFGIAPDSVIHTVMAQHAFLDHRADVVAARAEGGRIVEGHGDLRPEHVFLGPPPAVIDCVSYNRDFRVLDPADELAYLDLECEFLGAPAAGARVLEHYRALSGDRPPEPLLHFYRSVRATLRAKLAVWHLDDPAQPDPGAWRDRARRYLALAERHAREW